MNLKVRSVVLCLATVSLLAVFATPAAGQSLDVVIIGGSTLHTGTPCGNGNYANSMRYTYGGCLPVSGPSGELGDFNFFPMHPTAVSAASLAPFDTAVLNVASYDMRCNTNTLSTGQQADLVAFVGGGKKLIIYDSECYPGPVDYSWLPFPFSTANPGALGGRGTLTIVEDNPLSTTDPLDPYYIDYVHLGNNTDAVGDMNVMITYDANWCLDMSGTNAANQTGPVHTYAKVGWDEGLIIYNGLDMDYLYSNNFWLRKMWYQELLEPFNPSNLPCGFTVVGIVMGPEYAENNVGEDHTVTATLSNLLGEPQSGIVVDFSIVSGPNAGATGVCSANVDCSTDINGEVSFTYTGSGGMGTDEIEACFTNPSGDIFCSTLAYKEWVALPVPVDIKPTSCRNPFDVKAKGVLPVAILGTADFDSTQVDPATVLLAGVAPLRWSVEDVATPFVPYLGKNDAFDCTTLGPDGYADLTLKFDRQEVAAAIGPWEDGDVVVVPLDGFLLDGVTYIIGEDVIVILK
jgi:hypothetical protein